jgi:MinD superfamily P-loop ATPase
LCVDACPEGTINMIEQVVGKWFVSDTDFGGFVYARLKPGSENSGKLVTMVRKQAKILADEKKIKTILIDGPPGIGCPVIATLSGSDYVLIVSEPTFSGISDLDRIVKLVEHFGIPRGIVINRYDINMENTREIEKLAKKKKIEILARIPHSFCILKEISGQNIPLNNCPELKKEIKTIYNKLERITENKMEV